MHIDVATYHELALAMLASSYVSITLTNHVVFPAANVEAVRNFPLTVLARSRIQLIGHAAFPFADPHVVSFDNGMFVLLHRTYLLLHKMSHGKRFCSKS